MARRGIRRWALPFAAIALTMSCGGPARTPQPSPEAIATAQSVSRAVSFGEGVPTPTAAEHGPEAERPPISGRLFGDGPTGVILVPMRLADQTAWYAFATQLAATGLYTVLTFDFRGFGESPGLKDFDDMDAELTAALDYMRGPLAQQRVFLVGASTGGTAALVVASRERVAGVAAISALSKFQLLDAASATAAISAPKLFVASREDVSALRSIEEFAAAARPPSQQQVYEGNEIGTDILTGPNGDDLRALLTTFLAAP